MAGLCRRRRQRPAEPVSSLYAPFKKRLKLHCPAETPGTTVRRWRPASGPVNLGWLMLIGNIHSLHTINISSLLHHGIDSMHLPDPPNEEFFEGGLEKTPRRRGTKKFPPEVFLLSSLLPSSRAIFGLSQGVGGDQVHEIRPSKLA